jgi:phosphoglycolate phosphatase
MLFIFDWDGTLVDSKDKITQAMHLAVADLEWGPLEDTAIHNIIGLGLPEAISALFPEISGADKQRLRDFYAHHFVALDVQQSCNFFPNVMSVLTLLRNKGHLLAVATGKSRKGLDRILADLGVSDFFDATRCADETLSKPHPLMLEQLLELFDLPAQAAVMIGDTEYDMEMAERIGVPRIAVSYGAHEIGRMKKYEPELCLDRFDQLLEWPRLSD